MIARFATLTFDPAQRQVVRDNGQPIHLTPKAFDLLVYLIDQAPRVVPKSEIHEQLWPGIFVTDATLIGLIKELRRALQDRDSQSPIIRTSHGVGYAFCAVLQKPQPCPPPAEHWIVGPGGRMPLGRGENLIGRDPSSAVWLNASGVSRRHAQIVIRDHGAQLEDLGSKNGTILRGAPLTSAATLRDGDSIRIGPVRLTYRLSASGLSTETTVESVANGDDDTSA